MKPPSEKETPDMTGMLVETSSDRYVRCRQQALPSVIKDNARQIDNGPDFGKLRGRRNAPEPYAAGATANACANSS